MKRIKKSRVIVDVMYVRECISLEGYVRLLELIDDSREMMGSDDLIGELSQWN